MKRMKALLGVVLVIAMVLSLSLTAFAAGSITVADSNEYYKAWKVFDVAQNATTGELEYTLAKDSSWKNYLTANATTLGLEFIDPDDSDDNVPLKVKKLGSFSAPDFAAALKDNIPSSAPVIVFDHDTQKAIGLDNGYYLVLSYADNTYTPPETYAALTTVIDNDVTIQNKNDNPFDKDVERGDGDATSDDGEGVKVGDILTYTITAKIPSNVGDYTQYMFQITDIMDQGLELVDDATHPFTVYIGTDDITASLLPYETDNSLQPLPGDRVRFHNDPYTFELSIDALAGKNAFDDPAPRAGKTVTVTYYARVTPAAVAEVLENKAVLKYGENPNNPHVKDDTTRNYHSQIVVDKFETGNEFQKLSGAQFKMFRYVKSGTDFVKEYYYYNNSTAGSEVVEWKADKADGQTFTTDTNGAFSIPYLEDRYNDFTGDEAKYNGYWLEEIQAPVGYTLLTDPVQVLVNGSASVRPGLNENEQHQVLTNVANVANTPGSVLPSTGGRGTTMLYMAGIGMMLAAGAFLIFRRRAEAGK